MTFVVVSESLKILLWNFLFWSVFLELFSCLENSQLCFWLTGMSEQSCCTARININSLFIHFNRKAVPIGLKSLRRWHFTFLQTDSINDHPKKWRVSGATMSCIPITGTFPRTFWRNVFSPQTLPIVRVLAASYSSFHFRNNCCYTSFCFFTLCASTHQRVITEESVRQRNWQTKFRRHCRRPQMWCIKTSAAFSFIRSYGY